MSFALDCNYNDTVTGRVFFLDRNYSGTVTEDEMLGRLDQIVVSLQPYTT